MAVPDPAPEVEELETFSEITFIPTDEALEVVSQYDQAISDAKWLRTLDDIAAWESEDRTEASDLKRLGELEFFEDKDGESRLAFRNKVRRRYGYPPLTSETEGTAAIAVSSLPWF